MKPGIANELRVVALDRSAYSGVNGLDRNVVSGVASALADWRRRGVTSLIVLDRGEPIGATMHPQLRSVGRDTRHLVHESAGSARLLRQLLTELAEESITGGLVAVARHSFADRAAYFGLRDAMRGMLRNGILPIAADLSPSGESRAATRYAYLQVAGLAAAMLGADRVDIVVGEASPGVTREGVATRTFDIVDLAHGYRSGAVRGPRWLEPVVSLGQLVAHHGSGVAVVDRTLAHDIHEAALAIMPPPHPRRMSGVQRWLVAGAIPTGSVVASEFAATRLGGDVRGSLLAAGVVRTSGEFDKDGVVSVLDEDGRLLGYGVSRLARSDLERVRGKQDVVVVHADHFFGVGLSQLAVTSESD